MNKLKKKVIGYINNNKYNIILTLILIIGIAVRFVNLADMPRGINQDEAFAGYEAYSILNHGKDTYGYNYPVYLTAWGSGMNALYSYITMIFLALNGGQLDVFIIRLPQCILSCITLVLFYLIIKKIYNNKIALIGTFLLAINPWHIMLSRWGLEANIAPAFLMLGLFFLIKGIEKNRYFIFSAFFYGLSLYCYAPLWIAVPFILIIQFIYLLYYKKLKFNKCVIISMIIFIILALPLVLFVLINKGIINEIKTSYISIPRMDSFRGGEISFGNLRNSLYNFWILMSQQTDHLPHNSIDAFGIYYKFSFPLILIGIVKSFQNIIDDYRSKKFNLEVLMAGNLIASIFLAAIMNPININKINCIHIPIIFYCTYGLYYVAKNFDLIIAKSFILLYIISFLSFTSCYFTDYQEIVGESFQQGYNVAIESALEKGNGDIYVTSNIYYPKLLFTQRTPVDEFIMAKSLSQKNGEQLNIGRVIYGIDKEKVNSKSIYVIDDSDLEFFKNNKFTIDKYDYFYVAYKDTVNE